MKINNLLVFLLLGFPWTPLAAQEAPNPFDFGKMWTFENPPKEWFKEAYDFEPNDAWFEYVRKSSLRFANWCSASFISPDGLIMTNHHCSRSVVGTLQQEGENFDTRGFYAVNLGDERKAEGLFVEQLLMVSDITDAVNTRINNPQNELDRIQQTQKAFEEIQKEYAEKEGWANLRLQVVTYYSGGKYSLYGYKKYDDIRLVWLPEMDLGFYGGDPDNFTYPRYNLDVTFWRAYDENGNPVDTSSHYFKFNPNGITEGEVTFVVGNPGSTERYRTVAQLEYDRDHRFPTTLRFLENRHRLMMEEYETLKEQPNKELEAQEKLNQAFSFSNSIKAYSGILKGLRNPELFGRKVDMETYIRSQSGELTYWNDLDDAYEKLGNQAWASRYLSPSSYNGKAMRLLHALYSYENAVHGELGKKEIDSMQMQITALSQDLDTPKERKLFKVVLEEVQVDGPKNEGSLQKVLGDHSIETFVKTFFEQTRFKDSEGLKSVLSNPKKLAKNKDIALQTARILVPKYLNAILAFETSAPDRTAMENKIANQIFKVYGDNLPPDATFTLRISDGIVKGYEYNGTIAPYKTTYFGMYDRHYSFNTAFPWSLPDRWLNPPMELLRSPLNFVSTNDIIGGNSGSPMINRNREAIGLIFDSNIEALPGNFIYDDTGRTVSVHAGGIHAALRYIYKAERILTELGQ